MYEGLRLQYCIARCLPETKRKIIQSRGHSVLTLNHNRCGSGMCVWTIKYFIHALCRTHHATIEPNQNVVIPVLCPIAALHDARHEDVDGDEDDNSPVLVFQATDHTNLGLHNRASQSRHHRTRSLHSRDPINS